MTLQRRRSDLPRDLGLLYGALLTPRARRRVLRTRVLDAHMTACIVISSVLLVGCALVAVLDERRWRQFERRQRLTGLRGVRP